MASDYIKLPRDIADCMREGLYRIQLMSGSPDDEQGKGGFNRDALSRWVAVQLHTLVPLYARPPVQQHRVSNGGSDSE